MRPIRAATALLVPLAVMACGEQGGDQAAAGGEEAAAERQMTAEPDTPEVGPAQEVVLETRNESGVTGAAMLMQRGDSLEVRVNLSGLTSGEEYAVHVHEGTCDTGGGVAEGLNPVTGQSDGTGSSTAVVTTSSVTGPDASYFIQAHLPDGTPAACGDMTALEESAGGGM